MASFQNPPSASLPFSSDEFVSISNLSKAYRTNGSKQVLLALQSVSFTLRRGKFVSLVGRSGCGKSTLLKIVCGLESPTSGRVTFDGSRVAPEKQEIGVVFQDPALLEWRNIISNVMLPIELLGLDRKIHLERAKNLLSLVGLSGFEKSYPYQLSGGMRQRVALCRSLIHDPALLLMDEPFGALDAITRDQLNAELLQLWQERHETVLFVTHSIPEAVFLSDSVMVMSPRPGTIVTTFDINLDRPRQSRLRLGQEFNKYVYDISKQLGLASESVLM
jgi:NitT/TauT family transport system ATP-binding protein